MTELSMIIRSKNVIWGDFLKDFSGVDDLFYTTQSMNLKKSRPQTLSISVMFEVLL